MIRLRPFKKSDIPCLLEWLSDRRKFYMWSAGKFEFPLTLQQLTDYYERYEQDEHAWMFTALDREGNVTGHFSMRMADYEKESIHMGFIVLGPNQRGKGNGKEMVSLALQYAFGILRVSRVTLHVFDVNPAACSCYKSVGFTVEFYKENAFAYQEENGNVESWGLYGMAAVPPE